MKLWAVLLCLGAAWAQTPPAKAVAGEVTSVDSSAGQIKVKGDDGAAYIIGVEENTNLLRMPLGEKDVKKAEKIALSDINIGDRLAARGTLGEDSKTLTVRTVMIMTKADVAKK